MSCSENNLERCKVSELKAMLRRRGFKVSGRKADLIRRLRGHEEKKPVKKGKQCLDHKDYTDCTAAHLKALLKKQGKPTSGRKADLIRRLKAKNSDAQIILETCKGGKKVSSTGGKKVPLLMGGEMKYEQAFLEAKKKKKVVGAQGKDGYALVVPYRGKEYIAKVFKPTKSARVIGKEFEFQKRAADLGVSPRVYEFNPKHKYILMDKLRDTLPSELKKRGDKKFPEKWQRQIVEIYRTLDDNKILHNDANPLNFMIDHNDNVKIIDFGFAKNITKKTTHRNILSIHSLLYVWDKGLYTTGIVNKPFRILEQVIIDSGGKSKD